jgi:hypothetical protein
VNLNRLCTKGTLWGEILFFPGGLIGTVVAFDGDTLVVHARRIGWLINSLHLLAIALGSL